MSTITHIQVVDCRHQFLANGRIWLHAIQDGEIVGMLSLEIIEREWLWVNDLFVAEQRRRSGIADFLIDYAERFAQGDPCIVGIGAGVNRNNAASWNLFKKRGYTHSYTYPDTRTLMFSKTFEGREAKA